VQPLHRETKSAGALAEGLGTETADSVEPEAENDAVLFAQTNVEGRELDRRRTAIPAMSEGDGRTN